MDRAENAEDHADMMGLCVIKSSSTARSIKVPVLSSSYWWQRLEMSKGQQRHRVDLVWRACGTTKTVNQMSVG